MEKSKENLKRNLVHKSKIPIPLDPLPQMRNCASCCPETSVNLPSASALQRQPLKTLNSKIHTTKCVNKERIAAKNVEFKKKHKEYTTSYEVFTDDENKEEDKKVPEKSEYVKDDNDTIVLDDQAQSQRVQRPNTPALLIPAIRNIKRSLKRPHSRELQCISPAKEKKKKLERQTKLNVVKSVFERLQSPSPGKIKHINIYVSR